MAKQDIETLTPKSSQKTYEYVVSNNEELLLVLTRQGNMVFVKCRTWRIDGKKDYSKLLNKWKPQNDVIISMARDTHSADLGYMWIYYSGNVFVQQISGANQQYGSGCYYTEDIPEEEKDNFNKNNAGGVLNN